MRKITIQAAHAFYNFENFYLNNTAVKSSEWISEMYLYGNLIAKLESGKLYISSAGWETTTTKERLNGILYDSEYSIRQKDFVWSILNYRTGEIKPFSWFDDWYLKTF